MMERTNGTERRTDNDKGTGRDPAALVWEMENVTETVRILAHKYATRAGRKDIAAETRRAAVWLTYWLDLLRREYATQTPKRRA